MDMFRFKIYLCSALLMLGSLLISERAEAACESVTVTNLNFGNIYSDGNIDVTATVSYECDVTLGVLSTFPVCIQIGKSVQDSSVMDRRLRYEEDTLSYNIYADAGRKIVWGDEGITGSPSAQIFRHSPVLVGVGKYKIRGTQSIYGRLPISNFMAHKAGNYASELTVAVRSASINILDLLLCTTVAPTVRTLNVRANLVETCTVSADPLNFGSHPSNFASPVQSTSTINTACNKGSDYQIGLNNGQNAIGATRRMKAADGSYIAYELYNNSSYTQRWGSTEDTSEVVQGIATGQNQQATVYGQVQPQPGLKAATYEDTITVTVTY